MKLKFAEYDVEVGKKFVTDYYEKDEFFKLCKVKFFYYKIDGLTYNFKNLELLMNGLRDLRKILIYNEDCKSVDEDAQLTLFH